MSATQSRRHLKPADQVRRIRVKKENLRVDLCLGPGTGWQFQFMILADLCHGSSAVENEGAILHFSTFPSFSIFWGLGFRV